MDQGTWSPTTDSPVPVESQKLSSMDFQDLNGDGKYEKVVMNRDANGDGNKDANEVVVVNADKSELDDKKNLYLGQVQSEEVINTAAAGQVNVAITGSGASDTFSNATVNLAQGAYATINGTGNTITVGGYGRVDVLNAGGDKINGVNPYSQWDTHVLDGSNVTVTGLGDVWANNGTLNVTSGSSVSLQGWNESAYVASGDLFSIMGNNDVLYGSGVTLGLYGPSTTAVVGTGDTINLNGSNELLFASGDTVNLTMSGLTGVKLVGSVDYVGGNGTNDQFAVEGTNITGSLPSSDTITWAGATTGDSINTGGGGQFTTPDTTLCEDDAGDWVDDPIILNLRGGSVQTTAVGTSSVYFDMQNIGKKVQTGWGTAGEGYLVYDPNNLNSVPNDKAMVPGFAALTALDTNHDGKLSALDSAWSHLKVWVDQYGTGAFSASALSTVDQLGIASISLSSTHVNQVNNGNKILDDSVFTWKAGGTGDIAGVSFRYDPTHVYKPDPPEYCVSVSSHLPDGRTAGDVLVDSTLQLADESTLEADEGVVTHSKRQRVPGVKITTQSGISLVCSETAPIPTPNGVFPAPKLIGLKVATRVDDKNGVRTAWETVEVVESVGEIDVQHIAVGDKCFWAGEIAGAYILHHNKIPR
ncbi:hypothetical protein DZC73_02830 [Albitalea terrae]|uniref:Uncharacterized protein n=2 Tax=Piscinibacter terrae TaxID=2496871 RepID=A0A3N7K527_9BURK|nr:hypothetical protein DZC73_02830 [Albitalea terrae]